MYHQGMHWQLFITIGVFLFSTSIILRRILLRNTKLDQFAFAAAFEAFAAFFLVVYSLLHGFVWPDFSTYWPWILVTSLLYAAGTILSAYVLQIVEASIFSVLFATSALWTMLAQAVIFNTSVSVLQIFGTILIIISIAVLVRHHQIRQNKALMLGAIMAAIYGLANVGWAHVAKHSDIPSWNAIAFVLPTLFILAARPRSIPEVAKYFRGKLLRHMAIIGAVFAASSLTVLYAFSKGNVSVVGVLLQTNIIVTMLLGIFILQENDNLARKALSVIICFVAVLLIAS